jgi:chromosome condensin MukBEF ATPase and DNA-binding subunit MukB
MSQPRRERLFVDECRQFLDRYAALTSLVDRDDAIQLLRVLVEGEDERVKTERREKRARREAAATDEKLSEEISQQSRPSGGADLRLAALAPKHAELAPIRRRCPASPVAAE